MLVTQLLYYTRVCYTTLRGLNFAGIKFRGFRGFRGFRKNREIKSQRKICNRPSAKLNPHKKNLKNKTDARNFQFFLKQTYTVKVSKIRGWSDLRNLIPAKFNPIKVVLVV